MRHSIIFKREGHYSGMPNLTILPDGRLGRCRSGAGPRLT